ncbi:MAG: hypothetical protein CMM29_00215 [Rhodospirillaceae bacterium]|nr:hypothetical protein [Rhodospirillaceae bacterium]
MIDRLAEEGGGRTRLRSGHGAPQARRSRKPDLVGRRESAVRWHNGVHGPLGILEQRISGSTGNRQLTYLVVWRNPLLGRPVGP